MDDTSDSAKNLNPLSGPSGVQPELPGSEGEKGSAEVNPSTIAQASADASPPDSPLMYEETPLIQPVSQPPSVSAASPAQAAKRSSAGSFLGNVFLFILLFAVGVGLSYGIRQYLPSALPSYAVPTPSPSVFVPTPTGGTTGVPTGNVSTDPHAGWRSYQVISGTTKQSVTGVSFKLPPDILSPICDGTSCASQGTYLPGGTRFTVAARGKGQLLGDARGNIIITDSSGKAFTTEQTTVAGGRKALEYSGLFKGTTVGGYTFSQMRGFMIEVDEKLTLEVNHFIPTGVSADFTSDELLFDKILNTIVVTGSSPIQKGTILPIPLSTQSASSSSY